MNIDHLAADLRQRSGIEFEVAGADELGNGQRAVRFRTASRHDATRLADFCFLELRLDCRAMFQQGEHLAVLTVPRAWPAAPRPPRVVGPTPDRHG